MNGTIEFKSVEALAAFLSAFCECGSTATFKVLEGEHETFLLTFTGGR